VGEDPAAVGTVFDGAEEEVHVWAYPAVESVAVVAEVGSFGVGDHVFVGEPEKMGVLAYPKRGNLEVASYRKDKTAYQALKTAYPELFGLSS